ncbi:maleylpyruvate isomerase family mycothiol-dependent enzyme [Pseudonocardia ailaonensis]|uniref:Maleylpyruvate isomerase family mycothiol-dependent enzyme n=1 Tax=Pseudonocardia ailaonensis TaxID=367279 RepID=A0ABN2N229_9PSEU
MDTQAIIAAVEAERLGLADALDGLGAADWAAASLCEGWTVRDVAAHLTLATRLSPVSAFLGVLKARGDINRMIGDSARARSGQFEPAELVAQLRETAGSPKRPLGTKPTDPLVDSLVHAQDMLRPLGRTREMAAERVAPALDHVFTSAFYGAATKFAGLRLAATDHEWSHGSGPEVSGPAGELLLIATGRPAGLAALSGEGVDEVRRRVAG